NSKPGSKQCWCAPTGSAAVRPPRTTKPRALDVEVMVAWGRRHNGGTLVKSPAVSECLTATETKGETLLKARVERDDEDLVRLYLTDIGQYPLLTKDDEVRLAQMIEQGLSAHADLE